MNMDVYLSAHFWLTEKSERKKPLKRMHTAPKNSNNEIDIKANATEKCSFLF